MQQAGFIRIDCYYEFLVRSTALKTVNAGFTILSLCRAMIFETVYRTINVGIGARGFQRRGPDHRKFTRMGIDKSIFESSLTFQIDRAFKVTRQRASAHLTTSKLTFMDYVVLSAISHAANVPPGSIADSLDIRQSNFSNMVSSLEQRKLVARLPNGPDRRLRAMSLTKSGAAALQGASKVWIASEEELTNKLGDIEARLFVLNALRDLVELPNL